MSDSFTSTARKSSTTTHVLSLADGAIHYTAIAEWQPLYEREKAIAEIFHVAYLVDHQGSTPRPLTFVFNGGPGAASAYLHMGALGPKRIAFGEQGDLLRPPVNVVDNLESWLSFTDLVFVDPVGTGFSRAVSPEKEEAKADEKPKSEKPEEKETEFWEVERDLKALGEFIQNFLSKHNRWLSPIFIAGESYGGFRVAKLARKLQQEFGVGLSGAILISPALEFSLLEGTDYNLTTWATVLPSMAGSAAHHNRAQLAGENLQTHLAAAESFARKTLIPLLAMGDALPEDERQQAYQQCANLIGLPVTLVARHGGRIGIEVFARELLRDQQRIVGLYDASITAIDPFPDRPLYEGTDPTLDGLDRLFTGAINSHLRGTLGVETNLTYHLLNFDTFKAWKFELKGGLKQGFIGAVDDLRVGMTLNPYMQVYITHGLFDLVTPYFASNHLADLMKLNPAVRPNLTIRHFQGGHMFYTWEASRHQWFGEMMQFYNRAIA
ncbi:MULTISPECIES: peptidase S10 [unclassified Leptolyngbya]|uniref:S10 family peptidase n=1 Tax=unclassified Leptolyngbya TaxID=2650499 RepID=UPI001684EC1F|nr:MULTISPECIES: peptidase S10 [unclassified Leptolyngbya]MBD1909791.1 peptidase S10 [Leptolyngbya sp. FACHB-8]MBD2158942.1 peptidase S10 [Leptolyngbya sp. FACHB-16]